MGCDDCKRLRQFACVRATLLQLPGELAMWLTTAAEQAARAIVAERVHAAVQEARNGPHVEPP
jgi:hypothetical protein